MSRKILFIILTKVIIKIWLDHWGEEKHQKNKVSSRNLHWIVRQSQSKTKSNLTQARTSFEIFLLKIV